MHLHLSLERTLSFLTAILALLLYNNSGRMIVFYYYNIRYDIAYSILNLHSFQNHVDHEQGYKIR